MRQTVCSTVGLTPVAGADRRGHRPSEGPKILCAALEELWPIGGLRQRVSFMLEYFAIRRPRAIRMFSGLAARLAVIAAVESVDASSSFDEDSPIELISRLKPDVLIKVGGYTIEDIISAGEVQAARNRVMLVDFLEGRSTTRLIERIRSSSSPAGAEAARSELAREHVA
jgi:hypothetical protein